MSRLKASSLPLLPFPSQYRFRNLRPQPRCPGTGTGAEPRRPLGSATVGGLIFSQLLTDS
jgi:hypothetical protein